MKKSLTEGQLKAKIFQMVREQLEEQPKKYVSDYSEPAQELLNYAEKCASLKETLDEYAQQLEDVIDEVNSTIASIIGPDFKKRFWTSGDEVTIIVNLQPKDFAAIKTYLTQHQNEFAGEFEEYGDYEGMNLEEILSNQNETLEFLGNMLQEKGDEITNSNRAFYVRLSTFGQDERYQNFTYTNTISAEITCPMNFDNLESLDQIVQD
jgi:hypothetical protein